VLKIQDVIDGVSMENLVNNKYKILMVDDAPSNVRLLADTFQDEYDVLIATDGASALEIAKSDDTPDIILLDIMMQKMDGYEVIKLLKSDSATVNIPVIFVTAMDDKESQEYGFALGAVDYVTKPFDPELVRARVRSHLRIHTIIHDLEVELEMIRSQLSILALDNKGREHFYSQVFMLTNDGVMITDANEIILAINPKFTQITGYSADDALGNSPKFLKSGQHSLNFYQKMWRSIKKSGFWSGEITNRKKDGTIVMELLTISTVADEEGNPKYYIGICSDETHLIRAKEEQNKTKMYDVLTALPNRILFLERLSQLTQLTLSQQSYSAAITWDIRNFKQLNIYKDVKFGDKVLTDITSKTLALLPSNATLARLGGDIFAILLPKMYTHETAAIKSALAMANRIDTMVRNLGSIYSDDNIKLEASIGVTTIGGEFIDYSEIIKHLEIARFRAKKEKHTNIQLYDESLLYDILQKIAFEQELEKAIKEDQFLLYLQSQVDINGKLKGAEVLLRWEHPVHGIQSPGKLIEIAEESDLIIQIDTLVLNKTFFIVSQIQNHPECPVFSVNISAKYFLSKAFASSIKTLLNQYGLDPFKIKIEITERVLLQNIPNMHVVFDELSVIGIQFSLDDFGTGYSNLQYLKQFPFSELKIDKSFIDGLPNEQNSIDLVEAMLDIAHRFKLDVVVEGIEKKEQVDFFRKNSDVIIQGFYFAKPILSKQWIANTLKLSLETSG
jgi:diguanylate cyclase (GGDEF)-like protein/PAS domain S-box-containing protein